ncbi:MAG: hypothetical protein JSS99_10950 [Actinobacteria bacterium]|nr:hypothetical protein [Actinomycetota bacterium]
MTRRRALWTLGIATLVLFVVLAAIDRRMTDTGGPGIVGFELARTHARAAEILGQWGGSGRDAARASLWLDFLYLTTYGAFLWLAVRALRDALARRGRDGLARLGAYVAPLALVGAACDALEDVFLLLVLGGHGGSAGPAVATAFASVKFSCLAIVVLYLLGGLLAMTRGTAARA